MQIERKISQLRVKSRKEINGAWMKTRIKLKTCFAVEGFESEIVDLPEGVATVADLLSYLEGLMNSRFVDPESGETEFDLEILLNHKDIWFQPMALGTLLRQGDIVEIYPLPLGGG